MAIKKNTNGSWMPASYRKYGTETDTITTLPATVIGDSTPISSYVIKGNMEQSGTPTPSSPIYPSECGDLVASGEHAGQYKLSLTLGSTTTDIYLGEVQTTRRIKKLVLTGAENWLLESVDNFYTSSVIAGAIVETTVVCSHQVSVQNHYSVGVENVWVSATGRLNFTTNAISHTADDFKSFLAAQYAAGTPVIVWYVLAKPETGIVNEPIRKIGDYVDSISGTGLATSGTAQELDVDTTLKPSEVDLTYHGWHKHDDTKYST